MANTSIPPIDPHNITPEERYRLLQRQKRRNYMLAHPDEMREYQRQYHLTSNSISRKYHTLSVRIRNLEKTIINHIAYPRKMSEHQINRAIDCIERLTKEQLALNYVPRKDQNEDIQTQER
jgi:UDP-2,3-diacylglucosamine pyrophosphatase LpxH